MRPIKANTQSNYTGTENGGSPSRRRLAEFLGRFHGLEPTEVVEHLYEQTGREAIRHLFLVASSLDSMVIGESQILSQVKEAYQLAVEQEVTGPLTHGVFQTALKVARRVARETAIHRHRVSIPSVAVADFAKHIFDRFDDKKTLVIGAGEMAEETLRYLRDEGSTNVTVVNRNPDRAAMVARRWKGKARPWRQLLESLAAADLVISTTGAEKPIVGSKQFEQIEAFRHGRPLFILDLAVPRDFDPAIGNRPGVYLYSVDDLREACRRNRSQREKELPAALRIIENETDRFVASLHQRAIGPVVKQLRQGWQRPKEQELQRLFDKLPGLDDRSRAEISQALDRFHNKLLHTPLESLRAEARHAVPGTLLDAMSTLFCLKD